VEAAVSASALIVIDMLNRYEHEDARPLRESVERALPAISSAIAAAAERELLTVYVNDNHGDWSAGRAELCAWALDGPQAHLVEPVLPAERAAFVPKARHSIFYETALNYLLRSNGVERIVLTGQVTEQCILYSALDGYVRHFEIGVPRDAVAHIHADLADAALRMMERNMRARVGTVEELLSDDPR
jgi:nicotinamidase-related amidase